MISLFVKINPLGVIETTFFMNLNKDTSIQSIYSILDEESVSALKKMQQSSTDIIEKEMMIYNVRCQCLVAPLGEYALFFAMEKPIEKQTIVIVKEFVKSYSMDIMLAMKPSSEKTSNYYFDSIQRLNNQLVNKSREVEKMNQKLNRYNELLHNRLVKDALTGLTSRYQYYDEIMLNIKQFPDKKGVFIYLDIDDFKSVNDKYGHSVGDLYLVEFANRLKMLPFENTIIMRIAGDEFGVYIGGLDKLDKTHLNEFWKTIDDVVVSPIHIDNNELPLSISVGFAVYNQDSSDIYEIIDYADKAMYTAKKKGKNDFSIYNINQYRE